MVQKLTHNRISFFFPLLSKTFGLLLLTYRTVPLLAIEFIENMTKFAMSFGLIDSTNRIRINKTIFFSSYLSKVFRIYTSSIFTSMVYHHIFPNISVCKVKGHSVRTPKLFQKIKSAISVFIQVILPYKAITYFFIITIKSIFRPVDVCFHVDNYTPYKLNNQMYV